MRTISFTKEDSLILKGVAILLMMWHHCFLPGRFDQYTIVFMPFTESQVTGFASFGKICVSLFVFISGYGLYSAYNRSLKDLKHGILWVGRRYLKTFLPIWVVIILCWIITFFINNRPGEIYFSNGTINGIIYMGLDLLGLSKIADTPMMIATWWYLSACIIYIVLTPFLSLFLRFCGSVVLLLIIVILPLLIGMYPGGEHFLAFLPAFCMGMVFAKEKLFLHIDQLSEKNKKRKTFIVFLSLILSFLAYKIARTIPVRQYWNIIWGILPVFHIITIYLTICRIPIISTILQFCGKHSANIFLTHNFIRAIYCQNFIYGQKHFLLVILVLFLCSLFVSFCIERIKRVIRFDRLLSLIR